MGLIVSRHGFLDALGRRNAMKLTVSPRTLMVAATLAVHALAGGSAHAADDAALKSAIASPLRTPAFAARDGWRHPYETLTFFGLRPDSTVIELSPGAGWYTEILAPYLREKGQLILAADDPQSPKAEAVQAVQRLKAKLDARPDWYDRVKVSVFAPPQRLDYAPAGTADLVLTFRNVHNWQTDPAGDSVRAVFQSAFRALRVGGIFGVVEHRLPAGRLADETTRGYVSPAYVIAVAESVGFNLDAQSEVNANPRDTASHPGGVWALPPTYANGAPARAEYQAIGESDRMTLRFVKP